MQALFDLWQREDPSWRLDELAGLLATGRWSVSVTGGPSLATTTTADWVALIRYEMQRIRPGEWHTMELPSAALAITVEEALGDEFDTERPGLRNLLRISQDLGLDR